MSSVQTISTHRADALSRILTQSRERPNLAAVIGNLADMAQAFEDLAFPVLSNRALATAVGAQLDGIGQLVGQFRNGQSDASYRLFLLGRIFANNSDSTTETLLSLARSLFGATSAQVISPFSAGFAEDVAPAALGIEIGSPTLDASLWATAISVLKDSMAAAVRLSFVTVFDAASSFALDGPVSGKGADGASAALGMANLIYSDFGA